MADDTAHHAKNSAAVKNDTQEPIVIYIPDWGHPNAFNTRSVQKPKDP